MIERAPRLSLSADGRLALIDDRQGFLQLYTLPGGTPVLAVESNPFVYLTSLSNAGSVVATLSEKGVVEIASVGGPAEQFELPERAGLVQQMLVADDGRGLLFLAVNETGEDWRLDRWSLPFGDGPLATLAVSRPERPRLVTNGQLDRVMYWDDDEDGRAGLYALAAEEGRFEMLWRDAARPVMALMNDDWSWLVVESGLRGWRRDGSEARYPGSLRERLIFASQSQLLVYGGVVSDELMAPNETMMRFRLLDLESGRESGRLERPVDSASLARFMVSEGLVVHAVQAEFEGELVVTALGALEEGG